MRGCIISAIKMYFEILLLAFENQILRRVVLQQLYAFLSLEESLTQTCICIYFRKDAGIF